MINKVTKEDCIEAIEYLHVQGFVEEMTTDKKYYTEILLKKVANDYKLNLGQRMKTIQQKKINQLRKELEWYRLYANYIEYNKTNWDEYASNYADEKAKEVTVEIF